MWPPVTRRTRHGEPVRRQLADVVVSVRLWTDRFVDRSTARCRAPRPTARRRSAHRRHGQPAGDRPLGTVGAHRPEPCRRRLARPTQAPAPALGRAAHRTMRCRVAADSTAAASAVAAAPPTGGRRVSSAGATPREAQRSASTPDAAAGLDSERQRPGAGDSWMTAPGCGTTSAWTSTIGAVYADPRTRKSVLLLRRHDADLARPDARTGHAVRPVSDDRAR